MEIRKSYTVKPVLRGHFKKDKTWGGGGGGGERPIIA